MMFKNLKLSTKITLGFVIILIISSVIGIFTIFNMNKVTDLAITLNDEYMEEVSSGSNSAYYSQRLAYEMRGFALSGDYTYFNRAKNELKELKIYIEELNTLSEKYESLKILRENLKSVDELISEYEILMQETNNTFEGIDRIRDTSLKASDEFLNNAMLYLESQNKATEEDIKNLESPEVLKSRLLKVTWINNIIDASNEMRIASIKAQLTKDAQELRKVTNRFSDMYKIIEEIKKETNKQENITQLNKIDTSLKAYEVQTLELANLYENLSKIKTNREKIIDSLLKEITDVNNAGIRSAKDIANNTVETLNTSTGTTLIGLIISIIIGIILAVTIILSITKPVKRIVELLNHSSQELASASEELSAASQQLAEGSAEQAASLEETSSTLEESSSMVAQNNENTKQAAILSEKANESSLDGFSQMKNMMNAMVKLKDSSDEISKIIKVIDEIAFQTNILALNAAVEAARAGEAGQGFAVVAEEVRNLAQRSAKAARDTSEMIEKNIKLSEEGVMTSEKVKESLESITDQSKKVKELMDEIAAASQEQSQGIMQINKAISQMDQVTQQIASNAEESASSSEELSSQAVSMEEVVIDLVKLVYGSSEYKGNEIKNKSNYKNISKPKNNNINKKKNISEDKKNKTEIVNPEKIIPLDDDTGDF